MLGYDRLRVGDAELRGIRAVRHRGGVHDHWPEIDRYMDIYHIYIYIHTYICLDR